MSKFNILDFIVENTDMINANYRFVKGGEYCISQHPLAPSSKCELTTNLISYVLFSADTEFTIKLIDDIKKIDDIIEIVDTFGFLQFHIEGGMTYTKEMLEEHEKIRRTNSELVKRRDNSKLIDKHFKKMDENRKDFPGHTFTIVFNGKDYYIYQSYILEYNIRKFRISKQGLKNLLIKYFNFTQKDSVITESDIKIWKGLTGVELKSTDGKSLVGYMKRYDIGTGLIGKVINDKGMNIWVEYTKKTLNLTRTNNLLILLSDSLNQASLELNQKGSTDYSNVFNNDIKEYIYLLSNLISKILVKKVGNITLYHYSNLGELEVEKASKKAR